MTRPDTDTSRSLGVSELQAINSLFTQQLKLLGYSQGSMDRLIQHVDTEAQAQLIREFITSLAEQKNITELVAAVKVIAEHVPALAQALILSLGDLSLFVADSQKAASRPKEISIDGILKLRELPFPELLGLPSDAFISVQDGAFHVVWTLVEICIEKIWTADDCIALAKKLRDAQTHQNSVHANVGREKSLDFNRLELPFYQLLFNKKPEYQGWFYLHYTIGKPSLNEFINVLTKKKN